MEDILSQLFYGKYAACQSLSVISEDEKPEQHRRAEISKQLKSQVSEEHYNLIVHLLNSTDQTQTENMEKAFAMGVRLGAQFIMAACAGQEKEVREWKAYLSACSMGKSIPAKNQNQAPTDE